MPDFNFQDALIRPIAATDAAAAAVLSEELGYPAEEDAMRQRIEALTRLEGRAVLVACVSGEVVGWIDVEETHHLQAGPRAEIAGLVVSSKVRSQGIGSRLVAHAERWARERGLTGMVVRSAVARERAHRFYLREGYVRTKTSAVFTKELRRG